MSAKVQLDEALELALKLSAKERVQLIERLAMSIEREIEDGESSAKPITEHWGKNLLSLVDELGPIELVHPEIDDPTEWVRQIRREQEADRGLDWGQDE